MTIQAKYTHTNLVARDWRPLAAFYQNVFGCIPVPPERDLSGEWLEAATALPGAHLRGMHLRLPGVGPEGPTLEIFQYEPQAERLPAAANRPGFGHLAFAVPDVAAARDAVLQAGGACLGELITREIPGVGTICFIYMTDPEENILELQAWL